MQFRKKPVVVNAFKWTYDVVPDWWRNLIGIMIDVATESAFIPTLEGTMEARKGDYIIQGVNGEVYPCKPDIFAKTYEPADASPRLQEAAEWVRQYEAVQDIIFEAAISKAFDNRELIRPSIRHYFDGNNVNGQFLLTIKKLMRWTEKKVIEAIKPAPPKPNNE